MRSISVILPVFVLVLSFFSCEKETLYHEVNIKNGSGSRIYELGDDVQIMANPPADKMEFSHWSGDIDVLGGNHLSTSSFIMPLKNVELEAIYGNLPYFFLTIKNGSGSGEYLAESSVTIEAEPAGPGFGFFRWTGDTSTIENTRSPKTNLLMPFANTSVEATYAELPKYMLTINQGAGSGEYLEGTEVNIEADTAEIGMAFLEWIGDTDYLNDGMAANTYVTMPAQNIELTATYKEDTKFTLTVVDGEGSGDYYPREKVTISASLDATDNRFQQWEGDIAHVLDHTAKNTILTMPNIDISITAIYQGVEIPSFKNVVFPIIEDKCSDAAGCHGQGDFLPYLTTYREISLSAPEIKDSILGDRMPQSGSLSNAEIKAIFDWIDAGAPDN